MTHGNETAERQGQKEFWKEQDRSELSHTISKIINRFSLKSL